MVGGVRMRVANRTHQTRGDAQVPSPARTRAHHTKGTGDRVKRSRMKTRKTRGPISHDDGAVWSMAVSVPVVQARSGGWCERDQCGNPGQQFHHRAARGMGGSRSPKVHAPSNLLHLCGPCHAWVESNRAQARHTGLLVPAGVVAESWPVHTRHGVVFLLNSGGVAE